MKSKIQQVSPLLGTSHILAHVEDSDNRRTHVLHTRFLSASRSLSAKSDVCCVALTLAHQQRGMWKLLPVCGWQRHNTYSACFLETGQRIYMQPFCIACKTHQLETWYPDVNCLACLWLVEFMLLLVLGFHLCWRSCGHKSRLICKRFFQANIQWNTCSHQLLWLLMSRPATVTLISIRNTAASCGRHNNNTCCIDHNTVRGHCCRFYPGGITTAMPLTL